MSASTGFVTDRDRVWIPLGLAMLWPVGLVGLTRLSGLSRTDRLLLAAITVVGPCLAFGFVGPGAFIAGGRGLMTFVVHLLWSPFTLGGLAACLIVLWRYMRLGSSITAKRTTVLAIFGWLALAILATRV